MSALTIPVNGEYFDQILAGTKPEEYRLVTPYWQKRLVGRQYDTVVLTRGYPKAGGVEGVTRLTRDYNGFSHRTITHPHFGPDTVEVFAIDVSRAPHGPPPMNGPTTPIVEVAKRLSVPMREALLHRDRYADPNTIRALRKRGLIGNAARTLFGHQVADHLLASQVPGPISNERGDE